MIRYGAGSTRQHASGNTFQVGVNGDDNSRQRSNGGKEFELLDSPGVIPATLVDQSDTTLLAACNGIRNNAYDNQAVAAYLCEWLLSLYRLGYGEQAAPEWRSQCVARYGFDPLLDNDSEEENSRRTGESMLFEVAERTCRGDPEDAARKILQDFRSGRMGLICLQVAPVSADEKGQRTIMGEDSARERTRLRQAFEEQERERARLALERVKERGLELPPAVLEKQQRQQKGNSSDSQEGSGATTVSLDEVGKGLFEGW